MLSKNQIKYINSLKIKKYRQQSGAFVVEGSKSVLELLASDYQTEFVVATQEFLQKYGSNSSHTAANWIVATTAEMDRLGTFQSNDACLAVAKTKENVFLRVQLGEYGLMLDDVRDPGNLGTILRIADWYGITKIICSPSTTDFYNPKVIAASKGSFTRVQAHYTDLPKFVEDLPDQQKLIGAFLDGESLYDFSFPRQGGYIVMGNESRGIGPEVAQHITHRVTIPRFGGAESLNVGIATAVLCDGWRRGMK
ncbi:RNA methyltransferase [Persicitalea jodogahamensis]|uniref:RNA methyltransferase n=1 Tax=Persicitalea jodogahamensis TaxID=402147 RepID=A0A8J3D8S8_9BACT|nr:RNA methyltransferase [Persicitalea jodogahamensis]GHB77183.1 RNA methyltransferase [Persicitalea jodogahamensis]